LPQCPIGAETRELPGQFTAKLAACIQVFGAILAIVLPFDVSFVTRVNPVMAWDNHTG